MNQDVPVLSNPADQLLAGGSRVPPNPKGAPAGLGLDDSLWPAHSQARGRPAEAVCHLPASWTSEEPLGSRALGTRSHGSFPALKCEFWLRRKLPPRPCGGPLTISVLCPTSRCQAPHFSESCEAYKSEAGPHI